VVVPEAERERLVGDLGAGVIALDAFRAPPPGNMAVTWGEPDRDVGAVVLFTSGTTRGPKGVVHSLNTLTAGAANLAQIVAADHDSVVFLVSPLTSITGIMQMHLAADCHAMLVLEDAFDAEESLDRINAVGATMLGGAPVIAERLLTAAEAAGVRRIALRTLAMGGAMLPRPLLERAADVFGIEVARVYGSSEAPNFSGSTPEDDREVRLSDDGTLMPGSELRVGSTRDPGEGMVRGPGMFLGYADPRDNDDAFEAGWFGTGDLIELHSGRVTVVGRLKDVVNRNGLKIAPDEIDQLLMGMPGLREHASFGVPDAETGERVAVAVVPDPGVSIGLEDIIRHLLTRGTARRKLPEQVVMWDKPLPRTASGKVIRARLATESSTRPYELAERVR
jgi:acyl-CoA synthetase (AMP-forming)/AMP-acid ligase II